MLIAEKILPCFLFFFFFYIGTSLGVLSLIDQKTNRGQQFLTCLRRGGLGPIFIRFMKVQIKVRLKLIKIMKLKALLRDVLIVFFVFSLGYYDCLWGFFFLNFFSECLFTTLFEWQVTNCCSDNHASTHIMWESVKSQLVYTFLPMFIVQITN